MKKLSTKRKIALIMAFVLFTATLGYFALGYDDPQNSLTPLADFNDASVTSPPAMGVVPFGDGFRVDFDNNHINAITEPGHHFRDSIIVGSETVPINAGDVLGEGMPLQPERTDLHVFMSWNTEPDGSGDVFDANTPIYGNKIVYAQWGWRITFSAGSVPASVIAALTGIGDISTDPGNPNNWGHRDIYVPEAGSTTINGLAGVAWPNDPPEGIHPGYEFNGWRTSIGNVIIDGDSVITGTIFLVAIWTPIGAVTVTFRPEPGAWHSGHNNYRFAIPGLSIANSWLNPHYLNHEFLYQRAAPRANLANATLQGWWTEPFGMGTRFSPPGRATLHAMSGYNEPRDRANTVVLEDMTVYAHWVFRAVFEPNGGDWRNPDILPPATGGTNASRSARRGRDVRIFDTDGTPLTGQTIRTHGRNATNLGGAPQNVVNDETQYHNGNVPIPRRNGHVFNGWDAIVGGSVVQSGLTHDEVADWPMTQNITFRAMWTPIPESVEIIFDSNGGTTANRIVTIPDGNSVIVSLRPAPNAVAWPSVPVRAGYVFLGWYQAIDPVTNEGIGNRLNNATIVFYENPPALPWPTDGRNPIQADSPLLSDEGVLLNPTLTVYARWVPNVPVTFDRNGQGAVTTINFPVGYSQLTAGQIRRDTAGNSGDTFNVGSLSGAPSGARANQVPLRFSQGVSGLTAHGQSGNSTTHHAAWNSEPDGTGYTFGRSTVVTGPRTVYATWTGVVTFNNNHDSFSNASNSQMVRQVIAGQSIESNNIAELMFGVGSNPNTQMGTIHRNGAPYNNVVLISAAQMARQHILPCDPAANWGAFQLEGFVFLGWYTHPTERNDENRFTAQTIVHENMQVYAHWADAIVFNLGGAATHPNGVAWLAANNNGRLEDVQVLSPPQNLTQQGIVMPPNPTWPGRTFRHWNTSPSGIGGLIFDASTPVAQFFMLHAIWNVDVVFHPGTGVFDPSMVTAPAQVAGRPASDTVNINHVFKQDWTFHSWNTDATGAGMGNIYLHSTPIYGLDTGTLDLHAMFAGRVTFDLNGAGASFGGMNQPPSPINIVQNRTANGATVGGITNPNFPDPTQVNRPNYTFIGWNTDANANVDTVGGWFDETTLMTMGNITVFGIYAANIYNLTVANSPFGLAHVGQTGVLGGVTTTPLTPVVSTHNAQSGRGVTLTAGTVAGYTFIGWYRGTTPPADFNNIPAANLVTTNVYIFAMPAANVSYIALWQPNSAVPVAINAIKRVEGANAPNFTFGFTLRQVANAAGDYFDGTPIIQTVSRITTGAGDYNFHFVIDNLLAGTHFFSIAETVYDATNPNWNNDTVERIVTVNVAGNPLAATVANWDSIFTNTYTYVPATTTPAETTPAETTVQQTTAQQTTAQQTTAQQTTAQQTTAQQTTAQQTTTQQTTAQQTTAQQTTAQQTTTQQTTTQQTTAQQTTAQQTTAQQTTTRQTTTQQTTAAATTAPAQLIKTPDRMTAVVGETINWTLNGFQNSTGTEVANFTIVDIPGVGLNFRSGLLPAFTNGAGVTYEIRYMRAGETQWRVLQTGINAANPHSFSLPQPGNLHYTAIGFYFGNVPADFALGSEIVLTFVVGNAPNNVLVNNFVFSFDNIQYDGYSPYRPIVVTPTTPPVATTTPGGSGTTSTTTPGGTIQTFPLATTTPPHAAPTASNPTNTGTTNTPNVTPPFGPPGTGNHVPNGIGTGYFELDNQGVPRGAITIGALPQTGIMDNILWLASALFVALSASLGTLTYMRAKKRKRGGNL